MRNTMGIAFTGLLALVSAGCESTLNYKAPEKIESTAPLSDSGVSVGKFQHFRSVSRSDLYSEDTCNEKRTGCDLEKGEYDIKYKCQFWPKFGEWGKSMELSCVAKAVESFSKTIDKEVELLCCDCEGVVSDIWNCYFNVIGDAED